MVPWHVGRLERALRIHLANEVSRTIELLRDVLELHVGVDVVRTRVTRTCWEIVATVSDWNSLLVLMECAEGANVRLDTYTQLPAFSPEAKADPARALHHRYSGRCDDEARLQVLGAFLVWRSHRGGLISTTRANELLRRWNAVSVPHPLD